MKRIVLALVALVVAGCHHAPVVLNEDLAGRSSFAFVDPPVRPPAEVKSDGPALLKQSNFHEAQLQEPAPMPVYPAKALKAKARLTTIGVHITVDPTGRVSDIRSSMLVFNTPGPFADDFREAVETAVRQWRFNPAQADEYEIVHEGAATFNRLTHSEKVETEFALSFTFKADGTVKSGD